MSVQRPGGRLVWVCDVCQEKCFSDYNDACEHEQTCLGPSPPIQLIDDDDKVDDVDVNTSIISSHSNNNDSGSDCGDSSALTTSNDDNEFLPRELKQLLQRGHLHTKTCANCHQPGLLKCSRCKCQFYCSSDCQRAHFDQHKKNCKAIGKARKKIETLCNSSEEDTGAAQLSSKLKMTVLRSNLADLLVKTAHEECETLVAGRMFYLEALEIYASSFIDPYLKDVGHEKVFSFLGDRAMLMIMVCAGGENELESVFEICRGMVPDHFRFHFFLLLAYIMDLSKYRENNTSGSSASEDDTYFTQNLPQVIGMAITDIGILDHADDLLSLRDVNPFTKYHSIGLFSALSNSLRWIEEDNNNSKRLSLRDMAMISTEINSGGTPPEFWMIYQKCIRESFVGQKILEEYIEIFGILNM